MTRPSWDDTRMGARSRVALWLVSEVGVGGIFTKAMLRDAFPGVEQIDRRMRDLRASGWRIDTSRQDPGLRPDELRFVEQGHPVWEGGPPASRGPTARERQQVLERDHFCCTRCGIGAAETYPEAPLRRAHLTVTRLRRVDGIASLVTLCDMCRRPDAKRDEVEAVGALVKALPAPERAELAEWAAAGARPVREVEAVWGRMCRIPAEQRAELLGTLLGVPGSTIEVAD